MSGENDARPDPADAPPGYVAAERRAEDIARDPERAADLVGRAEKKAERVAAARRSTGYLGDLRALARLVSAWLGGRYRRVPWRTIVSAVAALLYFVNPCDVVPDVLPIIGFLDDAAVVAFVVRAARGDIDAFRLWEDEDGAPDA